MHGESEELRDILQEIDANHIRKEVFKLFGVRPEFEEPALTLRKLQELYSSKVNLKEYLASYKEAHD